MCTGDSLKKKEMISRHSSMTSEYVSAVDTLITEIMSAAPKVNLRFFSIWGLVWSWGYDFWGSPKITVSGI